VTLSAFLNISDIQRRVEALRVTNDNLNFSLETMMREIRSGSNYRVGSGKTSLTITSVSGNDTTYRLNNSQIEKSFDGGPFVALTAPEVEITNLIFVARGQNPDDGLQSRITIIINGSAGEKTKIKLNIQTTVSQRALDS
jgi:hypothetical protein